jgi:ERCC4-related helicase
MPSPMFKRGDLVQRVNQPEAVGLVQEAAWSEQQEAWAYVVAFGPQLRTVPESALRPYRPPSGPWDGPYASIAHLRFLMTYHRLRRPPSRIAHSFARSRTQFYPHQFKPLLKFLDHPGKRLLIADDVGLGKTIEAGYVLQELKARESVERVLVLVPSRLTAKWKREMAERFGEAFDVVSRQELLRLTKLLADGREPEPFRWIVSLEGARPAAVREALEQTQPAIDVLIADEAHRMRNPGSLQHKLGAALCRCADAVLFLSATPVQNKLEDLWSLLRLLSPEEFESAAAFDEQMKGNAHVLRAQLALAASPPDVAKAKSEVTAYLARAAAATLASTPLATSLIERLSRPVSGRRDAVELQSDVGSLSPIGHVLSRTRKADAIPGRAMRDARWHGIQLSEPEQAIYDNVATLCRVGGQDSDHSWGRQMALLMAYRMTASCIPAALEYFARKLEGGGPLRFEARDDEDRLPDAGSPKEEAGGEAPTSLRKLLQDLVSRFRGKLLEDSKLQSLTTLLTEVWASDAEAQRAPRKVVIFSFFPGTLEYVEAALGGAGIASRVIHGRIGVADREDRIDDFLERPDVRVLLSSEVGGEGIDLQRASVVVNYDLPWNPMVVEQRIGRLDRIGQEAERIIIRNLVIKGSVEEYVLQRLLGKIGIFRESIGEIDPIIGEEVEGLVTKSVTGELSSEELARQVEESERALERKMKEARDVLSEVDGLLAADQSLIDEVNAVAGEQQIPSDEDLAAFLNRFLADRYQGCQIPSQATKKPVSVDLSGPLADALSAASHAGNAEWGGLARRLRSGPLSVSFSREVGYRHPRTEVMTLTHPLIAFAVDTLTREGAMPRRFAARIAGIDGLPAGRYAFGVAIVEFHSHWDFTRLAVVFMGLDGQGRWVDPEVNVKLLLRILEHAQPWAPDDRDPEELATAKRLVAGGLDEIVARWESRESERARIRVEQRRAALTSTHEVRARRAEERLATLRERRAQAFPIRMAQAKLDKARQELEAIKAEPDTGGWRGAEREDVAVGLLMVDASAKP